VSGLFSWLNEIISRDNSEKREVIYQKREPEFYHFIEHREESWKYDKQCSEMWWNTVLSISYIFLIETKTTEKTEK